MVDHTSSDTARARGVSDAPHTSPITPAEDARTIALNRVSWGAVLAGVVVSLVAHLILNLIGVGIGAASLEPGSGDNPAASSFSIGAGIWFAVTGIIAALLGGFTAGRLAGQPKESSASWHGLTTWALTTLIIVWLLTTTAGALIGGAFSTLTNAMGGVAGAVGSAAQTSAEVAGDAEGDPLAAIQQAITGAANTPEAQSGGDAAMAAMRALLTGDEAQAETARAEAAEAMAQAQGIPLEQAETQVAEYEAQYRETMAQATEQATEIADTTADAVSTAALLGAFSLLLGAVAGWFGGRFGTIDPTMTSFGMGGRARSTTASTTTTTRT